MKDDMKPLIKKLVESYGPSGSEAQIRDLVRDEIRGLPDYITVDPLGNLIAVVKKKAKSGKKVILAAHLDEIGLVVSHIDRRGFARFQPFGGVRVLSSASKNERARELRASAASRSAGTLEVRAPSYARFQRPSRFARSTSARPGGSIFPLEISASAFARLSFDHGLFTVRGVKRCNHAVASSARFWLSIHPQASATSSAPG